MGGAVVGAAVTTFGAWLGGTTGWAALAKIFFVSFFINKAAAALANNGRDGASAFEGDRTQSVRQSAAPRKILFGETRVGGIYTFVEETDKDRYLQIVITLSGHECQAIEETFFDGKEVIAANGNPVSKYRGERASGTFSVTNSSTVQVTSPEGNEWLNEFRSPTIVQIAGFNNSANNGFFRVNEVQLDSSGGPVVHRLKLDTNSLVTETETSGVTIRADYAMIEKRLGSTNQSALTGLQRLAGNKWTSAHRQRGCAHVHLILRWDKTLYASGVPNPTFKIKGRNDIFDPRTSSTGYTDNAALCVNNYLTDSLLGLGADYATEVNEAALIAAANDCDESVALAGGGTEKRYTCNGRISTEATPRENLSVLCSAMAISAPIYSGGEWVINAGTYKTPTITFNDDNVRGKLVVATKMSRRNVFNAVKGTFFGPKYNYQEHGFPPVTNSFYETQDGERIWKDISLPMTDSPSMAQRIAKIELERMRQQIQVQFPMDLSALRVRAGNVINLTIDRYGWDEKPYEIQDWSFNVGNDGLLGARLDLMETASGVFDWNSGEETEVDLAPDTNLPDPSDMDAVTNLTLQSGTDQLWVRKDGTIQSAILATWDAPDEGFVKEFEIQVKRSDESEDDWSDAGGPQGGVNKWRITDVEDGIAHDVRVRIVSVFLSVSPWATVLNHTVIGKTAPPSDVADFSAQQNRELVTFKWPAVSDKDIGGYEIRYGPLNDFNWSKATVVTSVTKGTLVTNAAVPPGNWTVGIKSVDTSGNYAVNATTSDIEVINEFNIIDSLVSSPDWTSSTDIGGSDTGVVHHVSGRLVPESQDLADGDNQDVFDTFVINPVPELRYTSKEIDIGFDNSVRAWSDKTASQGPGETGDVDTDFYLAYKADGDPDFTVEPWAGGTTNARYFKGQLRIPIGDAVPYVEEFTTTIDTLERTERHDDFSVSAGGTTLAYNHEFHVKPNVEISSGTAGAFPFWANKTTTSVDVELYDSTGASVNGVVDVKLTGA